MRTITITPTAVATKISSLIESILTNSEKTVITNYSYLNLDVILECPTTNGSNITFGGSSSQDAFIIPGGTAGFSKLDVENCYIVGNGADTVVVVLPYSN